MLAAIPNDVVPLGLRLPFWSALPFAATLLAIAMLPVVAPRFWHAHYPKVVASLAALFVIPFVVRFSGEAVHEIAHVVLLDYVPFLVLISGLYATAGGLVVRGHLHGTPATNTAILAAGTVLASVVGTTGASMVLIRPLLHANAYRTRRQHLVVFFIFLVGNIGGCLTPLGDPPLFLGFLAGVPFGWTLHLAPQLLLLGGILLPLFFVIDRRMLAKEEPRAAEPGGPHDPLRLEGKRNLVLLAAIVGAVLLSGIWRAGELVLLGTSLKIEGLARDAIILGCGVASLMWTPRRHRDDNEFTWEPVREVAILFAAIFLTILPVLSMLRAGARGPFAGLLAVVREPWQLFWTTGILSSLLDNAPTYLTLFHAQLERFHPGEPAFEAARLFAAVQTHHLAAIAAGAVFMGATTYIGNAPNFMIKAIAERSGVAMPSFFAYVLRWAVPILVPSFLALTLVFF